MSLPLRLILDGVYAPGQGRLVGIEDLGVQVNFARRHKDKT